MLYNTLVIHVPIEYARYKSERGSSSNYKGRLPFLFHLLKNRLFLKEVST